MFLITSIVVALAILVYEYLVWSFDYWTKRGVPGPKPQVLLGNIPNFILGKKNVVYDYDEIYRKYKGQNSLVGIFVVTRLQLLVLDPEIVKQVLIKNFKNFAKNDFTDLVDKDSDPMFSQNPFMLFGEEWKEKRNEITPALTMNRIKAGYPLIENVCGRLTKYLNGRANESIDLKELSAKFTTDVVSNVIFAMDAESFTNDSPIIREMGGKLFSTPSMLMNAYFILVTIVPAFTRIYKMPLVPRAVGEFFTGLLEDAMEHRKKNKITRVDYLEHLMRLQQEKGLSNLDLAAHSVTFFLDGFETSSIFIGHVLFELSQNPEVQAKLRNEIKETKRSKGEISFESVAEMEYLDQICHETLRMHPPAVMLGKQCTEEIQMTYNKDKKLLIEKNMSIAIPVYSIHRDPEYYTNPDNFNPERFDAANGGIKYFKDKGVYLPFGDGPRICLGMKFALAQSKAAIVEIVEKFEILQSDKVQLPLTMNPNDFMNIPIGGLWAKFKPMLLE